MNKIFRDRNKSTGVIRNFILKFFYRLGLSLFFVILGTIFFADGAFAAVKIGVVTDTHYDRVLYPNRAGVAQNLISIFNTEGVNLVLGLGDTYDGAFTSLDDYLQDKAIYEAPYSQSKAPVNWVIGNHDIMGISVSDYMSNSIYGIRNKVIDLPDNWRIIAYANVDGPYNSAMSDTLVWLRNVLSQAKTDNKKVIMAAHAHIDLDYPSTPRNLGAQVNLTTRVLGTVLTPSATTGTATVSASLAGTFSSGDIGRPLHLLYGTTWGWGIVASFINSQTVTVNVKSAYGGTGPADSAEIGGFSPSSLNADDQRAIINEAVANGTQVRYVFSGHAHNNSILTVNGVTYYGFLNTGDSSAGAVVTLNDSSIDIAALATGGSTPLNYNHSTFFVDGVNGNDNNPGMVGSNAWKTLSKAAQKVKTAGNSVTILPATYRESVYFQLAGTSGNPITWFYQPGAKQSCAVIVAGFNGPDANGWFTKSLATQAKAVIEDGAPLAKGVYSSVAGAGTWDWNAGIIYYKPSTGVPTNHTVEAGQLNSALQIPTGVSYLTIKGGEFYGCNSSGILIQNNASNISVNGITSWGNTTGLTFNSTGSNNSVTKSKFNRNSIGIGIYLASPSASYNILTNNQTGIDIGGTSSPNIYNITAYANKYGFSLGPKGNPGPVIRNSITSASSTRGINSWGTGVSTVTNSIISDGANWGNTSRLIISTVNSGFVNPLGNNFNLLSTSPAIDFGINVGLTSDFAGHSIQGNPDAGAYEYQP